MFMLKRKLEDVEAANSALFFSKHLLEDKVQGNLSVTNVFS